MAAQAQLGTQAENAASTHSAEDRPATLVLGLQSVTSELTIPVALPAAIPLPLWCAMLLHLSHHVVFQLTAC